MPREILYQATIATGTTIRAVLGDLTQEPVDAIVNAANERLSHGGGVAGAIVRAGGIEIQQESTAWVAAHGRVPTGAAAITGAGHLPAHYVIHAVGPIWHGQGDEDELLSKAVSSAFALATTYGIKSMSLPGISTGIYGFPKERGARVIVAAVLAAAKDSGLEEINLTNIDRRTAAIFARALEKALASEE